MISEKTLWLKTLDILKNVPQEQLDWLAQRLELRTLKAKESLRICVRQLHGLKEVMTTGPGSISGFLPYSRGLYYMETGGPGKLEIKTSKIDNSIQVAITDQV